MRRTAKNPEVLLTEAQRLTDQASLLWNEGSFPKTESLCRQALKLTRSAVGDRDGLDPWIRVVHRQDRSAAEDPFRLIAHARTVVRALAVLTTDTDMDEEVVTAAVLRVSRMP